MNAEAGLPLLQVKQLSFSYDERNVFTHWSADFFAGLSWVRGPNGSGKSTLLQLICGALPPTTGALTVRGIDASTHPLDYRRQVFWCGSGPIAFDHLRPAEYFGFMRSLYPRFDVDALPRHIAGFGLAPHLDLRLSALSAGNQRKVWLAAALVANTSVVLIDEPVNALDADSLAHLHAALLGCAASTDRAWIVTSHEPLGAAGEMARQIALAGSSPPLA